MTVPNDPPSSPTAAAWYASQTPDVRYAYDERVAIIMHDAPDVYAAMTPDNRRKAIEGRVYREMRG